MAHYIKRLLFLFLSVATLALLPLWPAVSYAHTESTTHVEVETQDHQEATGSNTTNTHKTEVQTKITNAKEHLPDVRLKVCQNREKRINAIIDNSVTRQRKHLSVFKDIQSKVEDFYVKKQLAATNYAALVTAANQKHDAAKAAIDAFDATNFSCQNESATNPGSAVKTSLNASQTAIKDYRQSVHDLIIAVKTANQAKSGGDDGTQTQ